MKKFLVIATLLLTLSSNSFALDSRTVGSAGFDRLTAQQQADIISQVTAKAAENNVPVINGKMAAASANEWLDVSERISRGFAGAAKELGIAANDFAKTPVGMMTAALIVWHFMGGMIVHLVMGLTVLVVGLLSVWFWLNRTRDKVYTYDTEKTNIFGNSRLKTIEVSKPHDSYTIAAAWLGVLVFVVATAVTMTF